MPYVAPTISGGLLAGHALTGTSRMEVSKHPPAGHRRRWGLALPAPFATMHSPMGGIVSDARAASTSVHGSVASDPDDNETAGRAQRRRGRCPSDRWLGSGLAGRVNLGQPARTCHSSGAVEEHRLMLSAGGWYACSCLLSGASVRCCGGTWAGLAHRTVRSPRMGTGMWNGQNGFYSVNEVYGCRRR